MRIEPKAVYETRGEKVRDFLAGFVGWFLVNIVFGLLTSIPPTLINDVRPPISDLVGVLYGVLACLPWVVNLGLLVFFLMRRRWIAFGGLAAFGLVLLCIIIAGVVTAAICFSIESGGK